MTELANCPRCGQPLPAHAPAGLCPQCLIRAGLESEVEPLARPAATIPSPATARFEPLSVESLAGKFPQLEILELLGKGGMGAVYKARQRGLDRLVAVKVLPPEIGHDPAFAERFTREARALARLSHNHIVSVFDFGQSDGLFYIVMEYVDGVNLRQTIQTGKLTPAEALAIVPQICEALQFAHDEGIVHRDIKPENILIDKRGRVKIADFGLAKLLGQDANDHLLTATHQIMGTLRYMAPEQMQGSREVDHRADIYSLGVIFYELLTGELPMGKFAPPSKRVQIDVRLDEIVLRALEQQPEQRYQHASEVKSDVENISRSRQPTSPTPPEPAKRRREAVAGLPETQVRFVVSDKSDVPRQANFHFSTLGYQLIEQGPDLCVFERGSKWAGLWAMDIRRLHTILTVRTAPAADGGLWVSCNWSIRKLGSWIPKSEIVKLEEEGLGLAAVLNEKTRTGLGSWPPAGKVTPVIASEPRVSRFAIAGAVWAMFGFLAIIPALFFMANTAQRTDGETTFVIPTHVMLMGVLSIVGAAAPLGTTILGALAIGHIKRSGGRIIGLPLAVADVLFFPLLAVFAGIAVPLALTLHSVLPFQLVAVAVPSAVLALIVCLVVGNSVWRYVNPASAAATTDVREKLRFAGLALLVAGIMDAICGLLWIGHNVAGLVELLQQGAPPGWQLAWTCASLAMIMVVYYVIGVALHLMTLEDDGDFTFCLITAAVVPPGCLLGLPAAVYAFMQLTTPEAKALILKKSSELLSSPNEGGLDKAATGSISRHPAGKRLRLFGVLAAIMLVLACGVGWIQHNSSPPASKVPAVPPLKTITSGYGAQFLVPAGNVAVFEIVTREGNATVPVPTLCGYVMASQETPMNGTFLWSRMEEEMKAADGRPIRRWQIDIRTDRGGGGHSEGFLLPEGLDSAVGANSIGLGDLEPNEERVYWGGGVDVSKLPANGLIGLRVTVLQHGQNRSGTGISHTDWKTPPPSSTTRRKLDP